MSPSLHGRLCPSDGIRPSDLSGMHCLCQTLGILHFVWETSNGSGPGENNGGRGRRNSSVPTNNSSQRGPRGGRGGPRGAGNQKILLRGLLPKESSRNNTPLARGNGGKNENEKGRVHSSLAFLPSRPLKALHVGLSEALFQPSPLLIRKCCRRASQSPEPQKRGKVKV